MNKKSLFAVTGAFLAGFLVVTSVSDGFKTNLFTSASENNYTLSLTKDNKPTINAEAHTGTLSLNEFVTLNYTNLAETQVEDAHVTLANGGAITKTLASYSLHEITATFTGDLTITTGYTLDSMNNVYELTSGQAVDIVGNYFSITSTEYAVVNSITLNYGCINEAVDPTSTTNLKDYTISYLEEDKGGYYAANEFNTAIAKELGEALEIQNNDTYVPTEKYLHFATNAALNGKYTISRNDNVITLASYDAVGLIEAAKSFINRLNNDNTILNSWYVTPVEGTYQAREKVSMMTFNVRVGNDGTRPNGDSANITNRYPRVLACIKNYMPDSLGVQEASDAWISYLTEGLAPQYGYVGYGRESNYKGESTGIFYNRDKVTLLESGTKWLSPTPEVAGSGFEGCQYKRIFTYAILQRHSDNYIYMHINTHLDLNATLRKLDVGVFDAFAEQYVDSMPMFVTGDYNAQRGVAGDAMDYMIDDLGYIDVMDEALDCTQHYTFSQDGYNSTNSQITIDFCMKKNRGLYFTKYLVDTAKYSGDGVEKPQVTSDHYPLYFEAIPYEPIEPQTWSNPEEEVEIDNGFIYYDKNYSMISNKSEYANNAVVLAKDSTYIASSTVGGTINNTKYTSLSGGTSLTYAFEASAEGKGDLALSMAHATTVPTGTALKGNIKITLNGTEIDLADAKLRCTDIRQLYEWETLALRNVDLKAGRNELKIEKVGNYMPDNLLLNVFSDSTVTALKGTPDVSVDSTNKIMIGTVTRTVGAFNAEFPTTYASVEGGVLTFTTTLGQKTVVSADGPLNTSSASGHKGINYSKVIVTGGGTLEFNYSGSGDGIYCNSLQIDEGTELSFTKASKQGTVCKSNKGTINIKGTLSVNNFNYGFGAWSGNDAPKTINVSENGVVNMTNVGPAFFGNSSVDFVTSLVSAGTINITGSASSAAIAYSDGINIQLTGDSQTTISFPMAMSGVKTFFMGNGSASDSQPCNASFTYNATGTVGDAIELLSGGSIVINTLGKFAINGNSSTASKTAIKYNGGACTLVIKCADMTISGYQNAFGSWKQFTSYSTTYEYEAPYAKLKYKCLKLYSNTVGGNTPAYWELFSPLDGNVINLNDQ